ncbi:MAG TPA: cytochrome-c oxidase, cbb3-type subunit II, partial [Tepidisphaeraceae bacterium]|nr:cytochrome-c oxidase, cbb3-type subunit II [Tepidisphaeraceae bacterium]
HYTDWTIAHVHSGTLGWVGFMCFGMMYWLLPRLFQTKLHSQKLANLHFWVGTIGILLYIIPIYVAGVTEGLMWRGLNDQGQLLYPDFVESVKAVIPMWTLRAVGGSLYLSSVLIGGWNFLMTWRSRPAVYEQTAHYAPPLARVHIDPPKPVSSLDNVADIGKKLDVFSTFWFHRRWERLPLRFTIFVTLAVLVASAFEMIPTFLIRSNVPTIASVRPYTPLELYGRDIYLREGCYLCHSQMIRPLLPEVRRFGEYSKAGEFVYDHPFQWGSRRIGPDLAREGGKQNELWHFLHFQNPPQVTPGSVMPQFTWLFTDDIDFDSLPVRVHAMQRLGVPYTDDDRDHAIDNAHAQAKAICDKLAKQGGPKRGFENKEVIALIAYLQRMGTDLFAPAPAAAPATPLAPVAGNARPAPAPSADD